jgi:CheY-like chemotaxis protein
MRRDPEQMPILVVDDDELSRFVVARRLHRWGYEPVVLASAEEALAFLRRFPARALVSDVHMPGLGGMALVRAALGLQPDLPIFLMTANPAAELWQQAAAAGARDVLAKQAGSGEALRAGLARALAPAEAGPEDVQLAHSLRTPLTALKGAIDLLCSGQLGELPESQRRFAGIAQRNVDRMITLVEDLLEASARP